MIRDSVVVAIHLPQTIQEDEISDELVVQSYVTISHSEVQKYTLWQQTSLKLLINVFL